MYPEFFEIPVIHLTIKSFGMMMVIGFLSAVWLIRYLSRNITPDPKLITNAALYSLIAGVLGARLFYVVHYFQQFRSDLLSIFAIWQGGLELLGGVVLAITVIVIYLWYHKLPVRRYLDILAIGLMLALVFGRIGCFLNGCCFGRPTDLPWAVTFPYNSFAFKSQINPDYQRNRPQPLMELPDDFFGYVKKGDLWYSQLKAYDQLTDKQKEMVDKGPYRCPGVHPTQLYSSLAAVVVCLILYLFWRGDINRLIPLAKRRELAKPGCTFALMFVLYGFVRFFMEFLRDDNPLSRLTGLTISQHLSIALVALGVALMILFTKMKPDRIKTQQSFADLI